MSETFVIAQGGGPTAVINQTVAGATIEAKRRYPGARVLGAKHGVRGVRDGAFVDLSALSDADLKRLGDVPNAALGSTRDKPDAAYCDKILDGLRKVSATGFIYIGGNDTAGTLKILEDSAGSDIAFVHAPKTIDNDLVENDHTPGFISAAWFVASSFLSVDYDFRAMPGLYVGIVMGRHAGFLTAAGAAWRKDASYGPHLVYVPEKPFSVKQFIADVGAARERHGRAVVAMSEGVSGEDGRPLVESLLGDRASRDAHGNVELSGGDLGLAVQSALSQAFPKVRARVDTFGYLPRAFANMISDVDQREAFEAGRFAAESAGKASGSVALRYTGGKIELALVPLDAVAGKTRHLPPEFIVPAGNDVSEAGLAYFRRLIPARPDFYPPLI